MAGVNFAWVPGTRKKLQDIVLAAGGMSNDAQYFENGVLNERQTVLRMWESIEIVEAALSDIKQLLPAKPTRNMKERQE